MAKKKTTQVVSQDNQNSDNIIERAISDLEKLYGPNTVIRFDRESRVAVEIIPTGSILLDRALGVGGLPRGRVVEIYGSEGSGKTTICFQAIAKAQELGHYCAFIDMEHAVDPTYMQAIGVQSDKLYFSQPETGEQALEIVEKLSATGKFAIIVVDSVAALVPRAEIEGAMGDSHMGMQARLMSQAMRKLVGVVKQSNTILLFTNQVREKIGVMYGDPTTTTGGRALKFAASVRLSITGVQVIKDGSVPVGKSIKVTVKKNKVGIPFREAELRLMHDVKNNIWGIDNNTDIVKVLTDLDIVRRSGAWYEIGSDLQGDFERRFMGLTNIANFFRNNREVRELALSIIDSRTNHVLPSVSVNDDIDDFDDTGYEDDQDLE